MLFKDIPNEIKQSELIGEMIGWNMLESLIEDFPASKQKENIIDLIDDRRKQIIELEL